MKSIIIIVILFIVVILLNVINIKKKKRILETATAITEGRITDVKFCEGDRREDCFYYWKVSYSVDGRQFTMKSGDSGMRSQEMKTHIGETVEVHYDPENPANAYAIVYGVKAWHGAAAF